MTQHNRSTTKVSRRTFAVIAAAALLSVTTTGHAKLHPATPECRIHVSVFDAGSKPLSYETAQKIRGAMVMASSGVVYAPVTLPNGREAVYAVDRNGCVRQTRFSRSLR